MLSGWKSLPMPATTKCAPTRARAAELRDSGSSVEKNAISAHTSCKQMQLSSTQDDEKV